MAHKKILIVDDDPGLLKILQVNLISHGFTVLTAETGEQGLELIKKDPPDLVILDVILPGIKGREVCKRIKEDSKTKDIPVIFLTAKDSSDDIAAELKLGAIAHLTKPIDFQRLLLELRKILD